MRNENVKKFKFVFFIYSVIESENNDVKNNKKKSPRGKILKELL